MNFRPSPNRKGASAIIILMLFVVAVLFAFLTINLSNIQRYQAASQISSDLGARWGVDMVSRDTNQARIKRQVEDLVARNWTVNHKLTPGWLARNKKDINIDVTFGSVRSNEGNLEFHANQSPTNAVRVNSSSFIAVKGMASTKERDQIGISRSATSVALERDICLVVDRSGSMNFDLQTATWSTDKSYHSYNPLSQSSSYWRARAHYWWWYWPHPEDSRWSTMIPAIHGLADELDQTKQNELFSIVSYSTAFDGNVYTHGNGVGVKRYSNDASSIEYQPSFDYEAGATFLENRYMWDQPVMGGTNISAGIDKAVEVLTGSSARPNAFKTMIVMTDGQYNDGREPWLAAEDALAEGIEVYTVTFSHQADQSAMEKTALWGNGKHFHAPDGDSLDEIFRTIANIPPAAYIE